MARISDLDRIIGYFQDRARFPDPTERISASRKQLTGDLNLGVGRVEEILTKYDGRALEILQGGSVCYVGEGEKTQRDRRVFYSLALRAVGDLIMNRRRSEIARPSLRAMSELAGWITGDTGLKGEMRNPDAVLVGWHPRRLTLHSLEIEHFGKLELGSIYQAHAASWGADFAWVVCAKADYRVLAEEKRFHWIVAETGVGVITYEGISKSNSYKIEVVPRQRKQEAQKHLLQGQRFLTDIFDGTVRKVPALDVLAALQATSPSAFRKALTRPDFQWTSKEVANRTSDRRRQSVGRPAGLAPDGAGESAGVTRSGEAAEPEQGQVPFEP